MRFKITQDIFTDVKKHKRWHSDSQTMRAFGISDKTLVQIKACRDFETYTAMNKSQHPGTGYSLADNVINLHRIVFDTHDGEYLEPRVARKALEQLKRHFIQENRNNDKKLH